ncbi:tetratricopeptide repeat protein [Mesonia maritima]|uniref:Tetratricopeptide repeat protein n=1 Tax=Mesonia maritima TaxID=1793873 RepID=A0ABU1K570_9FLAO|nr:tetratricopeptide repeat protein [Mesonia maritima]MDR6299657.1 hypothetical protein [Mesonia maritima]
MKRKKMTFNMKHFFQKIIVAIIVCSTFQLKAQDNVEEAKVFMAEAEEALAENNFPKAEAKYREAIAKDKDNAEARYNLGNLYYNKEKSVSAVQRLHQSSVLSEDKTLKHKAYHNQGNAFMKEKKYALAVEAYKNALRNDPTDEETRYNFALAKEKLKKEQQQNKDNKDDKNQDQKNDKKENEDKNEKDGGENEQNKKDNKDDQSQNKDEKKGDQKKDEGDQQKKDQQQPKQEKGDENNAEKNQQQQPAEGKLSKQQIKNLLEAMENQEKKIQDKINAKKEKGQKRTTEKDW